ncbi:MAG TPA: response regulator [Candidatus Acidoferrales bacterium]|nr:response regulator [Candidatus Acidoferrales bacterium]
MKTPSPDTPHILIVDDNQDGLLVRKSLLEEVGYRVQIAINGDEALKAYAANLFDVVVTDYRMPRMNGVELIQQLRVINPDVRVVLLSGFVDPLGLTVDNTGADVVLAKSAHEPSQLVRSVKRLVNSRSLRKPILSQRARRPAGAAVR